MREDDVSHAGEEVVEEFDGFAGLHFFGHGGEAAHVGEEHGDALGFATEADVGGVGGDFAGNGGREKAFESAELDTLALDFTARQDAVNGEAGLRGDDGENFEIVGSEGAAAGKIVHVKKAEKALAAGERRAHGRLHAADGHAVAAGKARVFLGVHDEKRAFAFHDLLDDGARENHFGSVGTGRAAVANDGRKKVVTCGGRLRGKKRVFREEHGVAALAAVNLQDEVENTFRDVFDGGFVAEGAADLIEEREKAIFAAKEFEAGGFVGARLGPLGRGHWAGLFEKLGDAFGVEDLREMRSEFGRGFGDDGAGGHIFETQANVAEGDDVAAFELGTLNARAVEKDAVGAAQIGDTPGVAAAFDDRVGAGDAGVGKGDVVGSGAADAGSDTVLEFVEAGRGAGALND